jgi:hypothetical protein
VKTPLWVCVILFLCANPAITQSPNHIANQHSKSVQLDSSIRFSFDINDLITNHQFKGQKNSFHVLYEYAGLLKGGAFDPQGHKVSSKTFPYFQSVRSEIVDFVQNYHDIDDFYELFGEDICADIMRVFPQIKRIELTIDVPAFAAVNIDRRITVVLTRKSSQKPRLQARR